MGKTTYKRAFNLRAHSSRVLVSSMAVIAGSMAVGRRGTGAVADI